MARAMFQKGQRVYVKPLGAWANVERLIPQWVRGVEEPLKVLYDVGLGREFAASELDAEVRQKARDDEGENWRLLRLANRWLNIEESLGKGHPHPGTHPVVVTEEIDWGGWRVPAAEYARSPERIEHQARVIANAMRMLRLTRRLSDAQTSGEAVSNLVAEADAILRDVFDAGIDAPPERALRLSQV